MSTSLAHLFDHDVAIINKAELVVDRLMEILLVPELNQQNVRDSLINFISIKTILNLLDKSSEEIKQEAKYKMKEIDIEFLKKVISPFDKPTAESAFYNALKTIVEEKYEALKPSITTQQSADIEQLIHSIGQ